jgi:carbon-monoxide dehydrogenase iron sulfur subunit
VVRVDQNKCVGCYTCVLTCPYGAILPDAEGHVVQKCELCLNNAAGSPACVRGCPNRAIVFEEEATA